MIIKTSQKIFRLMAILACMGGFHSSIASEGGGSHYLQGTYGDFGMALSTPSGFYVRNDVIYMGGKVGAISRGHFILDEIKQDTWVNALKLLYVHDEEIFGGNWGVVLGLPYVLDVSINADILSPLPHIFDGSGSGLSDPYLYGFINWKLDGFSYLSAGVTLFSDLGSYDADKIINMGRNYLTIDPVVAYTYLNTENGREFSLTAGVMFNEENDATNYKTGSELHVDYMLAQHFSNGMALGINGYYYDQLSKDKGEIIDSIPLASNGFKSRGYGLGPAFLWSIKREEANPITLIAKWLHDFDNINRLDADVVIVAAAFKF